VSVWNQTRGRLRPGTTPLTSRSSLSNSERGNGLTKWKTPRVRSAEDAFASGPWFGDPRRRSHESVVAGLVRLLGCSEASFAPSEGSVCGSQGHRISVEPSVLTPSVRGLMHSSDSGCPSRTRSGKILGGDNRRLRARRRNSVLRPTPELERLGWSWSQGHDHPG